MSGGLQAPLRSATGSSPCLGEEFMRGCGRFSMVKNHGLAWQKTWQKTWCDMVWYGKKKPWLSYNQHGLIWFDMAKKMWFNYPSKMVWRWLNIGLWPSGEMVNIKWRIPSFFRRNPVWDLKKFIKVWVRIVICDLCTPLVGKEKDLEEPRRYIARYIIWCRFSGH